MPISLRRIGAAGLVGLLATSGAALAQTRPARPAPAPAKPAAPAPAQPAQPAQPQAGAQQAPGPTRVDLTPSQADWTKECFADNATPNGPTPAAPAPGAKQICLTTRDFGQAADQPPVLALAIYDVPGDENKIVRLLLPPALLLQPGFRFSVDKGPTLGGVFVMCLPNGCFAESKVPATTIASLKTGTTMTVAVINQAGTEVAFGLPLAGFGKAFDGPAIDPKVLEAQQQQLRDEMAKRAEQERSKLEGQAPAPAAGK